MKKNNKKILILIILLIVIVLYVAGNEIGQRMRYSDKKLEDQYNEMIIERDNLRSKIESKLSIEKLDKIARDKKLSNPDSKSIVLID